MMKYVALFVIVQVALVLGEDCKHFKVVKAEKGRLDGEVNVQSEYKLHGLWVRLFFDHPVTIDKLPEGFEAVKSEDEPNSLLVKNRKAVLLKNVPLKLTFSAAYEGADVPKLTQYRLNARNMCPEDKD